jgi:hypothetical protein
MVFPSAKVREPMLREDKWLTHSHTANKRQSGDWNPETKVFFIFFFVVLGFELSASCLLARCCTIWATPLAPFMLGIFEKGSCFFSFFAQAGLRLQSS